jgi:hypothetical protein
MFRKPEFGAVASLPRATGTAASRNGRAAIHSRARPRLLRLHRRARQDMGAAMNLVALREARDPGFTVSVLGSSEMSYPVYRRLGFIEYCRIGLYECHPR